MNPETKKTLLDPLVDQNPITLTDTWDLFGISGYYIG